MIGYINVPTIASSMNEMQSTQMLTCREEMHQKTRSIPSDHAASNQPAVQPTVHRISSLQVVCDV